MFHAGLVSVEKFAVEVARIPVNEYAAEIEDGYGAIGHAVILSNRIAWNHPPCAEAKGGRTAMRFSIPSTFLPRYFFCVVYSTFTVTAVDEMPLQTTCKSLRPVSIFLGISK